MYASVLRRKRGRWFHIRPIYFSVLLFLHLFLRLLNHLFCQLLNQLPSLLFFLLLLGHASSRAARQTTLHIRAVLRQTRVRGSDEGRRASKREHEPHHLPNP